MPRTADSVNHLQRLRLAPGTDPVKFPTPYLERLYQKSGNKLTQDILDIVKEYLLLMDAEGYPASRIFEERTTIADEVVSKMAFAQAIANVTKSATVPAVEEDDEDDILELSDDTDIPEDVAANAPIGGTGAIQGKDGAPSAIAQSTVAPTLTPEQEAEAIRRSFRTDDEYFFGVKRINHPDKVQMTEEYVNGDDDRHLQQVLESISFGLKPTLLTGDPGTGKTFLGKHYSFETGDPYFQINCNAGTELAHFIGEYVPDGKGGYIWQDGLLTLAMEANGGLGGVFVCDEYDMVKPGVTAVIRDILLGGWLRIITQHGLRIVKPGPRFRVIATRNGRTHAGTQEMAIPDLERFACFKWGAPSAEKEKRIILTHVPGFSEDFAERLIAFANETRAKKKNDPDYIRYVCSTRTLVAIARYVSLMGWTLREAVDLFIVNVAAEVDAEEFKYVYELVDARFPADSNDLKGTDNADPLLDDVMSL